MALKPKLTAGDPYPPGYTEKVHSEAHHLMSSSTHEPSDFSLAAPILLGETPEDTCPYLAQQRATLAFYKIILPSGRDFDAALENGFRRHGSLFYQPACAACRECVPIRVGVADFAPSKSQRRLLRRHASSYEVRILELKPQDEHVELFNKHAKMISSSAQTFSSGDYGEFLVDSDVETRLLEYRFSAGGENSGRLIGVSFLDLGEKAVSSCYFFWDPEFGDMSPGTFSALWEIDWCRQRGYRYYYLGYWIRDCQSMSYKSRFQPHERRDWSSGQWVREPPEERRTS